MAIEKIAARDPLSRVKMNAAIDKANLVDGKASTADLRALPSPLPLQHRPGEAFVDFGTSLASGEGDAIEPLPSSALRNADSGRVVRQTGAGIIAPRRLYAVELSRRYLVTFAVQRRVNSPDPSNDAIRLALAWYDQAKTRLPGGAAQTVVQDLTALTTGSGRTIVRATVARAAGDDIDVVSPGAARYVRPFVQTYGVLVENDIEIIGWTDITDAVAFAPDVSAIQGQVDGLISLELGDRTTVLESQVTAPNSLRIDVMGDLLAYDVPASVEKVELLGYYTPGDLGAHRRVRGLSGDPGAQQSVDGAYWVVAPDSTPVRAEMFGCKGDGTPVDRANLLVAHAWIVAHGGPLRLAAGKDYNIGTTYTDLGGIVIDPEPGATITGDFHPGDDVVVTRECVVNIVPAAGDPWTMRLSPRHKQPLLEKSLWLAPCSFNRSVLVPIDCLTELTHHELAFPGSDTISINADGVAADVAGISLPARAAGGFRVSLARMRAAEEITAFFDDYAPAGDYGRVGFFRLTNGFLVVWLNDFGTMNVGWKAVSEDTGSLSGVDWIGRTEVPVYTGRACYLTLRLYDWQTVGVLVSDKEVWRGKIGGNLPASLGAIYRAGFGVTASSAPVTIGNWTRRTGLTAVSGLAPVGLLILGDSLSERWHMAYEGQLIEALYNTAGMRAEVTANYALGGQTSAQQLAKLQADGVPAGTTVCVATLGGNDQQGGVNISTLRDTWDDIKAALDALGVRLHFILSNLPYTTVEAPGHGSDFSNYLNSHLYRTLMMRWAADNGVSVTQSNQAIPPQTTRYIGTAEPVMRDNAHWSPMSVRTIAVATAYDIAGLLAPAYSDRLDWLALPGGAYMNAWENSADAPVRLSIRDGWVEMSGAITKASGVADQSILQLPPELAPAHGVLMPTASASNSEVVRTGVLPFGHPTAAGQIYVNGTLSGDTTIWLDGLRWKMLA